MNYTRHLIESMHVFKRTRGGGFRKWLPGAEYMGVVDDVRRNGINITEEWMAAKFREVEMEDFYHGPTRLISRFETPPPAAPAPAPARRKTRARKAA